MILQEKTIHHGRSAIFAQRRLEAPLEAPPSLRPRAAGCSHLQGSNSRSPSNPASATIARGRMWLKSMGEPDNGEHMSNNTGVFRQSKKKLQDGSVNGLNSFALMFNVYRIQEAPTFHLKAKGNKMFAFYVKLIYKCFQIRLVMQH